ncbi:MAG: c-type cytochrome [Rhodospirillales bacterium]|nr:c-type cytochrome [Rhodospirillales bacterium]
MSLYPHPRMASALVVAFLLFCGGARADLIGHGGMVRDIAISPDGAQVLTASFDYSIRLWDFATQQNLKLLDAHTGPVNTAVFLPDGKSALSAGKDGAILRWDLKTAKVIASFTGHGMHVMALALRPGGKTFASASWDGTVRLWSLQDGSQRALLKMSSDVNTLAFGLNGDVLFTGHKDGRVRLWVAETGEFIGDFVGHAMAITRLVVSYDGSRLLSAGIDGSVRLWFPPDRNTMLTLKGHDGPVYSTAFTPDGFRALSGGHDGIVNLWDLSSGRLLRRIEAHEGPVWAVAFSPDGRFAISSGSDEAVRIWHLETGDRIGPTESEMAMVEEKPWLSSNHPGARLFRKCAICHSLTPNGKHRSGPHLEGLFGRLSGSLGDYNYSEAMRTLGVTWTRKTVRQLFFIGPDKFVPGTKMPIQKVSDPEDLNMLIDYLMEVTNGDKGS